MLDISVDKKLGTFTLSVRLTTVAGVTALFGRSGSGKTTLINMLAGLETPQQGHIRINDTVLFDAEKHINLPPEKRRIGYVFQDSRLFPHLSVEQNLTYGQKRDRSRGGLRGSVHGQAHAQTRHGFGDIVDLLALSELLARRPRTLSGGEKQRVAIGRALLSDPDIMLMDEPLASLDAAHRAEILPFIEQLRDELRIPVVYVSHSLEEVIHLADTIAVMADGRIAASGAVEDVLSRLDIIPVTGRHEAGAVVLTTIMKHDDGNGLSEVSCAAGTFTIPRVRNPVGESLRLRLRARDISLATEKPRNTSILNIFQGRIMEIDRAASPSQVDILVDIGVPVIARITTRSLAELGLVVGSNAYVMVKAVSIDRPNPDAPLIIHQR